MYFLLFLLTHHFSAQKTPPLFSYANFDGLVKSQDLRFWQRQLNELRSEKWVFWTFYESINFKYFFLTFSWSATAYLIETNKQTPTL